MKSKFEKNYEGFILFETLLAFSMISVAVLFFHQGEMVFLLDIESKMIDSRMYRVLSEEVIEGRIMKRTSETVTVERNGNYEISYRLEDVPYAQITCGQKQFSIYRK